MNDVTMRMQLGAPGARFAGKVWMARRAVKPAGGCLVNVGDSTAGAQPLVRVRSATLCLARASAVATLRNYR